MEPFRVITTIDELAALRVDSIVCPPRIPSCAYWKAWAGSSKDGKDDSFAAFRTTREAGITEVWAVLTMHCPEGQPSAWVLWDSAAEAPAPVKPSSWTTVIPSRRPARKAHTSLGYAKAAITHQMYNGTAREDMVLQQLNPATGTFDDLFTIPKGTPKTNLPW